MKGFTKVSCWVALLWVILQAGLVQAAVVYSNLGTYKGAFETGSYEVADEITIAGDDALQNLTEFSFMYSASANINPSATVTLAFYKNDGALVSGYASPGTVIWKSAPFPIQNTSGGYVKLIYDQANDFGNSIYVPRNFTWSVKFENLGLGSAGVGLFSPPTVGNNFDTYWQNDGTGWAYKQVAGVPMNFGATVTTTSQITPVPEPAAVWGLAISAAMVIAIRAVRRWRRVALAVPGAN
jgi:hypothetical protein